VILYLYPAVRQFPKSEKFGLALDMKKSANKILRLIIEANKVRNKRMKLYEIDTELDVLKNFNRISKDLGFMPFKKYENLSKMLIEIGRMLGGWIKSQG